MRKVLGLLSAIAAASVLFAVGAGEALATTVHCGDTITQDTTLDSDLVNCPESGVVVPASTPHVTINLNGHVIDGVRAASDLSRSTVGVLAFRSSGVTVENGVIQEFGDAVNAGKTEMVASNMVFRRNYTAFEANHSGATITDNGQHGAEIDYGGSVLDSIVSGNRLDGIYGDQIDPYFTEGGSATLLRNTTDGNGDDGIEIRYFPQGATVSANHAWRNGDLGIEAVSGTRGGGNWAKHNGNPLQCVPSALCSTNGKPKG